MKILESKLWWKEDNGRVKMIDSEEEEGENTVVKKKDGNWDERRGEDKSEGYN